MSTPDAAGGDGGTDVGRLGDRLTSDRPAGEAVRDGGVGSADDPGDADVTEPPGAGLSRSGADGTDVPESEVDGVGSATAGPGCHADGCSGPRKASAAATSSTASTPTPTETTTQGAEAIIRASARRRAGSVVSAPDGRTAIEVPPRRTDATA
ncbi:hypothetical protein [Verrucosispora sp. TAA-831]|uniref:hypothetical protein n=1 Tax=Verrucosispora sp. TAA-831 TaxID=3422227 RepID=UPI003D6FB102